MAELSEERYAAVFTELHRVHVRSRLCNTWLPQLWRRLKPHVEDASELMNGLIKGLVVMKTGLSPTNVEKEMREHYPSQLIAHVRSWDFPITEVLKECVASSVTEQVFDKVKLILLSSVSAYEQIYLSEEDTDDAMDTEESSSSTIDSKSYWETFQKLVQLLNSLGLLQCFTAHAATVVVQNKVEKYLHEKCSQEFSTGQLSDMRDQLHTLLLGWIGAIYGTSVKDEWSSRILYHIYLSFGKLRIEELFDIIVEYPDSEPALADLRECLHHVELRSKVVSSLRNAFQRRLLHPGANTSDIITQYISSVRGLRILDPRGVVLEQVCEPLRSYLRSRDDTVRCIVASLTDDTSNELAEELATGQPILLDLSDECENENQNFDAWEPDPVDADPYKSSKSRQSSDIISLLVNIYGSHEMFVGEYRNLLADRLLQSLNYDTSREVRNLELLKLRFGEGNLHFCDVMIKDVADSRRINTLIQKQLKEEDQELEEEELEMNALILSHVFWPTFREEQLKVPEFIQNRLDSYKESYETLKGMRTLEWRHNLGLVQVDLELGDRTLSFSVTPPRASIIWNFQEKSTWTVEEMSGALEAQPSVVRRHLGFWVMQGVLREGRHDSFTVVEQASEAARNRGLEMDDSDSAMASAEEQKENDLQVMWSYIVGMLTNLGKLPLDRIHMMLKMFAMQGSTTSHDCTPAELKTFLDKKVKEQQLICSGGLYQLNKSGT